MPKEKQTPIQEGIEAVVTNGWSFSHISREEINLPRRKGRGNTDDMFLLHEKLGLRLAYSLVDHARASIASPALKYDKEAPIARSLEDYKDSGDPDHTLVEIMDQINAIKIIRGKAEELGILNDLVIRSPERLVQITEPWVSVVREQRDKEEREWQAEVRALKYGTTGGFLPFVAFMFREVLSDFPLLNIIPRIKKMSLFA